MSSPIRLRSAREGRLLSPFPNRFSPGLSAIKDGLDTLAMSDDERIINLHGLGLLALIRH
jgi:hypothetical protein